MLLQRIEVENFRGLRQARLEFDGTTVLIGENSAGKTTLLDAIAICLSGRDDIVRLEVRDFHQDGATPPAERLRIALTFSDEDVRWTDAEWAPFGRYAGAAAGGRRSLRLEVIGIRNPGSTDVVSEWAFESAGTGTGTGTGGERGVEAGLLTAWRRLVPVLRLRANRYIESDPRGDAAAERAAAEQAVEAVDPVARQIEQQIRLVYDRLTGAVDIADDELARGLEAAQAYLEERTPYRVTPASNVPVVASDVAETPVRGIRQTDSLLSSIKQGSGTRGLALIGLIGAILEARDRVGLPEGVRPLLVLEDIEAHLHPITMSAMWELVATMPAQKIVTTNSGELLGAVPLRTIRRLVTDPAGTRVYSIDCNRYSVEDLRRIGYHVRINRAGAFFARCWLLVEGETEAWLLPELAQICGYDLPAEGIRCVEFAQAGLKSLLRLANDLGIEWHLLTDGDEAGRAYAHSAAGFLRGHHPRDRITMLEEPDIEHCLYDNGFSSLYREAAGASAIPTHGKRTRDRASAVIARAIHAKSKPGLALAVLEAAHRPDSPGVPPALRATIEAAVRLAQPTMVVGRTKMAEAFAHSNAIRSEGE